MWYSIINYSQHAVHETLVFRTESEAGQIYFASDL